jgi:hypothetical protein
MEDPQLMKTGELKPRRMTGYSKGKSMSYETGKFRIRNAVQNDAGFSVHPGIRHARMALNA